ncbi:MAG: 1-phosphofructokinase [Dehalococcoidia bacterium]|nr:1-phosphofructokinase [Dehalococcoidia bacterium]
MIITLTLNPAMDKTVFLDRLVVGEVNRAKESLIDPGGKGINVSRVIRELGQESLAMGFVSGSVGRFVEHALNDRGIFDDFIHTPGQTRTNIEIVEQGRGVTTNINDTGPTTDPKFVKALRARLHAHLTFGSWLVVAGSVPPGIEPDVYAGFIDFAKKLGANTILDADGTPLVLGVAAGPTMIKPNWRELEALVGRLIADEADVFTAAMNLHERGIEYVVVSMGKQGSIAICNEGKWKVISPQIKVVSTTGAGDSLVAGIVLSLAGGKPFVEGLRLGTAAGAATALAPGTQLCKKEDVDRLIPQVQIIPLSDETYASHRGASLG